MIALGPFSLKEPIGKGGMGEVWLGEHVAQHLPVAIKLLTTERAKEERFRASFRNEVRLVAALEHPHIVRVFDYGEVPVKAAAQSKGRLAADTPYLAMEYVEGGTLRRLRGRVGWVQLREIINGLLDALAHAHARGMVHRDIKPGNVLLGVPDRNPNGKLRVQLTDFGVAHALSETPDEGDDIGTFSGTPAYMAPEQFLGRWRDYGPWTDLYAFGCLIWTVASGRYLFGRKDVEQRAMAHLRDPVPPLELKFAVPVGFEDWLRRLLEKRPDRRFQCAADAAWAFMRLGDPDETLWTPGSAALDDLDESPSLFGSAFRTALGFATGDERLPLAAAPLDGPIAAASVDRPPLPQGWHRRRAPKASMQLIGAGLGLFGLRPVPLVGREAERDAMWAALHRATSLRKVQAVVLRGPSGCGKTRLAEWLGERAAELGAATVMHAEHGSVRGPGHGLTGLLARSLGCTGMSRSDVLQRINRSLRRQGITDPNEWKALTEWISPATPEDIKRGVRPIRFGSNAERYVVLERLLERACRQRPVVLVLDDVQWGLDALQFTTFLLERDRPLPVVVVVTATEEALSTAVIEAAVLDEICEHERTTRLAIGPLDERYRSQLIEEMLSLEPGLARQVDARTAGNPLFAIQLVGDWVARDLLVTGNSGFALKRGIRPQIPDDVHQVWSARIERILEPRDDKERFALEIAAVLGQEVHAGEWRAVCQMAGATPSDGLVEALLHDRLARSAEGGPQAGWSFAHVMLQESLYRISREKGRLQTIHRLIANLLEDSGRSEVDERLGRHLVAAGDPQAALEPLRKGIDRRIKAGSYAAAEALLVLREQAMQSIKVSPAHPLWGENWLFQFQIQIRRMQYDQAERWLDRTEKSVAAFGWKVLAVRAQHFRGRLWRLRNEYTKAIPILREAEKLTQALGDKEMLAELQWDLAEALGESAELGEAESYVRRSLKGYMELQDEVGCALCWQSLGEVYKLQGRHEEAARQLRNAQELYEEAGYRWGEASALNSLGDVTRYLGDAQAAVEYYDRAGALFYAIGSGSAIVPVYNKGLVLLEQNRISEARPILLECLGEFDRQGRLSAQMDAHLALAGCAATDGDWLSWDQHMSISWSFRERSGGADEDTARLAELVGTKTRQVGDVERAHQAFSLALTQWRALQRDDEATRVMGEMAGT